MTSTTNKMTDAEVSEMADSHAEIAADQAHDYDSLEDACGSYGDNLSDTLVEYGATRHQMDDGHSIFCARFKALTGFDANK